MYDTKDKETSVVGIKLSDFILAVTIILATVANFTDFSFSFKGINRITAISVLIYIVTTMTYNHFYNKGKLEGKLDEGYIAILKEYDKERDSVLNGNLIGKIPSFIEEYIKNDIVEYRKGILVQYDMEYDEYENKYLRMSSFEVLKQKKMRLKLKKAIIKCNRAKPVSIHKSDIITSADNSINRKKPIGVSGNRMEKVDKTAQSLKRLLLTVFSGAIGVDIVLNFSWIAVVTWAIRMLPILTALVTGQGNGFKNITETEVGFKKNQIYMIRLFKEWCGSKQ